MMKLESQSVTMKTKRPNISYEAKQKLAAIVVAGSILCEILLLGLK